MTEIDGSTIVVERTTGTLERVLALIAVRLRYERPAFRIWPDVLLVPPVVIFGGYYLAIIIDGLLNAVSGEKFGRTLDSFVANWPLWPAAEISMIVAFVGGFVSLALFGLFHGIREGRTATIVLAGLLLFCFALPFVLALSGN